MHSSTVLFNLTLSVSLCS